MVTAVRNLTHGQLTIADGATTPNTLVVPVEQGNFEFTVRRAANVFLNRGVISGMTPGIEEPMQVTFGLKFQEWLGDTRTAKDPSPVDALIKAGNAAAWVSTLTCGPYTVDLQFHMNDPCASSADSTQDETLTFVDFHADEIRFVEGEEFNELTVSGTSLALVPTSVRVTST